MMTLFRMSFFAALMLAACSVASAQQWQHPYHDGTTQVYESMDRPGEYFMRYFLLHPDSVFSEHFYEHRWPGDHGYYGYTNIIIRDTALFSSRSGPFQSSGELPDGFPINYPLNDFLFFNDEQDTVKVSIERRFDTTINNETVRAFKVTIPGKREFTIADKYGIVLEWRTGYGRYALHSMESQNISYNWETIKRRPMPLCETNVYQYYYFDKCMTGYGGTIEGYTEQFISPPINLNGREYFNSAFGLLREDDDGVHVVYDSPKEGLAVPSNLTIGTPIFFYGAMNEMPCVAFVTDTATVLRFGKKRFVATIGTDKGVNDLPLCIPFKEIVDGIGIIMEPISRCALVYAFIFELRHFSVCGETYGTFVSAPPLPKPASFTLSPAYPNPVSGNSVASLEVSVARAGDFKMALYNEAGMLVREWSKTLYPGTHALTLDTHGLVPGAYRLSVRSGEGQDSEWVVVR